MGGLLQRNCPLVLPPHGDQRRLDADVFVEAVAAEALGGLAVRAALYRCNDEGEVDAAGGCLCSMLWWFLSLDDLMVMIPSPSPSAPPCLLQGGCPTRLAAAQTTLHRTLWLLPLQTRPPAWSLSWRLQCSRPGLLQTRLAGAARVTRMSAAERR
jgi:hypothetical protein